ncbi:guanylate kinase [Oenococcus oeni]|uniref:guanylate kinase n=1 Tax=Oenococcus oeni TaxID=1247 RepID=UPI000277BB51|nr:guanylate kinase [Oenococcus oeni]EJO05480.1 guanylate kinase [Oenococcus oeni AWRIB548]KEP86723.1 guanylate kinase [Oenococcus oeni IOEB_0205]KGH68636.1 guanylate kinase [Oenococcus oeni IOEB_B16]OIL80225.1 guanylate kinase [Oenococcus oeni]OIL92025.1 guanylate kinase [Oenococcus oeni]
MNERGMLFLLSGPSGVGKGTVRKALFKRNPHELLYSISATTREARRNEVDGKDYFFVSKQKFEQMINEGQMLEYAQYVDQYYGTPKTRIDEQRQQGNDVFMEIEVNGAMQVRAKVPDAILIFLLPPDLMQLRNRLELRGTESDKVIDERLKTARQEILMMTNYDYAVVNDKVDKAVKKVQTIIGAERLKAKRLANSYIKILEG